MNIIDITDLKDQDLVASLHMDDYFPEDKPCPFVENMVTFKEFKDSVLEEIITETESSVSEAFALWRQGSGDGGENYCLLALKGKQIFVVSADIED